jgi:2-hydroxychromene-2-carboxylate isomerase
MGELIHLDQRRTRHARPVSSSQPTFFFDVACPLSYLTAERIERTIGRAEWVPVSAAAVHADRDFEAVRTRARAQADALRLPLVWPERFPAQTPCALRATVRAAELGAGPRFALAVSRLAFCGGFDLEDPETLAEAAAAAGVPLEDCLQAAGDPSHDRRLDSVAARLRSSGIEELPVVEVDGRLLEGESGLLAVRASRCRAIQQARPLAPAG